MRLGKKKMTSVSFMLFSLFFGAGNLIFPPFLGHSAGEQTFGAFAGFVLTAVVLPVLAVAVIARWESLEMLSRKVSPWFGLVFTVLIYLALGPGLAIPRAASVPFEMAVAPYLPEAFPAWMGMLIYSLVFFALSAWLALTPSKLVNRLGNYLTPALLFLLLFLFVGFLFGGESRIAAAQPDYAEGSFYKGFTEGYLTMDTLAGLVFGVVIASMLRNMGVQEDKRILRYTAISGVAAGLILGVIYFMLTYIGTQSSGVYALGDNGVWTLRCVVEALFGTPGAVLLAAIFTLACLTTCVGLINSVAHYFAALLKKVSYKQMVWIVTIFSFVVCNQGLSAILNVSVPILNALYPVAIVLILMGLTDRLLEKNPYIYPCTVGSVAVISVIHALDGLKLPLGFVKTACSYIPLYDEGFAWVSVAIVMILMSVLIRIIANSCKCKKV